MAAIKANALEGEARGVARVGPGPADPRTVLSFRLERFNDAGDREVLGQVELRGLFLAGSLQEGDRVTVLEAKLDDGTFVASKVKNETTGAVITARGLPGLTKWAIAVSGGVLVVITVVAVYLIVVGFSQVDQIP
jgi:hypothetical protein